MLICGEDLAVASFADLETDEKGNYKTSGKYRRCQQNVISVAVTLPLRCCRAALCVTDKSLSDLNHWMRSVNDTARSNLLRLAEQLVVEFFRETNTARVLHPITSRLVALFPLKGDC